MSILKRKPKVSYWFVCYTTAYVDLDDLLVNISGEAVLKFENESFLPGTAVYTISKSSSELIKNDSGKIKMDVHFVVVQEISEEGFENFGSPDADKITYTMKGYWRGAWSSSARVNVI